MISNMGLVVPHIMCKAWVIKQHGISISGVKIFVNNFVRGVSLLCYYFVIKCIKKYIYNFLTNLKKIARSSDVKLRFSSFSSVLYELSTVWVKTVVMRRKCFFLLFLRTLDTSHSRDPNWIQNPVLKIISSGHWIRTNS